MPEGLKEFVKKYSQELSGDVIASHIKLYVNDFSINLGDEGRKAIAFLFEKGFEKNLLPKVKNIFLSDNSRFAARIEHG